MTSALIAAIDGREPDISPDAFVAPHTVIVGRVVVGPGSSVWYGSVLRGDDEDIVLGADCNVQDGCVLHADPDEPAILRDRVSLGHGAVVHGGRVDSDVLIGMRAVVLNGAHIGSHSLVAPGRSCAPGWRCLPARWWPACPPGLSAGSASANSSRSSGPPARTDARPPGIVVPGDRRPIIPQAAIDTLTPRSGA